MVLKVMKTIGLLVAVAVLFLGVALLFVNREKFESAAISGLVVDQWVGTDSHWAAREDGAYCRIDRREYARLVAARKNPKSKRESLETTCQWSTPIADK